MNHKLITLENLKKFKEKTIDLINSSMNGVLCSTAAGTQIKEIPASAMPGFVLYAGATINVLFQNACTVSYPQLKVGNTAARKIMVYRGGMPVYNNGLPASSGKWRGASTAFDEVWQPYTTLELMYDGMNWVVMGDPVIENYFGTDFGYEKKANGLIKQWGKVSISANNYTDVPVLEFKTDNYSLLTKGNFEYYKYIDWNCEGTGWALSSTQIRISNLNDYTSRYSWLLISY